MLSTIRQSRLNWMYNKISNRAAALITSGKADHLLIAGFMAPLQYSRRLYRHTGNAEQFIKTYNTARKVFRELEKIKVSPAPKNLSEVYKPPPAAAR